MPMIALPSTTTSSNAAFGAGIPMAALSRAGTAAFLPHQIVRRDDEEERLRELDEYLSGNLQLQ